MNILALLKYSALISLGVIIIIPLIGMVINFIVTIILSHIIRGKLYLFVANTLTFPGVMYHELSHALFAFITGAKIEKISLYHKQGNQLGSVEIKTRGPWINRSMQLSFSACAPVIMGLLAEGVIFFVFAKVSLPVWAMILLGFLAFCILLHMDMSGADIKGYLKGIVFVFFLFFVIAFLTLYGGNIDIQDMIQSGFKSV